MSWVKWNRTRAKTYSHWRFEDPDRERVIHLYHFKPEFWLDDGCHPEIKTKDEWQFTTDHGNTWHVIPKELTTLEERQAYVHTIYRLEEL